MCAIQLHLRYVPYFQHVGLPIYSQSIAKGILIILFRLTLKYQLATTWRINCSQYSVLGLLLCVLKIHMIRFLKYTQNVI